MDSNRLERELWDSTVPVVVATCNLNQWALDFNGNLERIKESIVESKRRGARYRLGPELEVCGYGCEDHYLETDTFVHCDESLAELLAGDLTCGILCDVGMPVLHNNVRYNCRVLLLNRKILMIRPKMYMADDGNYRETRWFTTWKVPNRLEDHHLSGALRSVTGQVSVPFGVGKIVLGDTVVGSETCEELFTPRSPHINLSLAGVEIIGNGSGSHHQLRKLDTRLDLVRSATAKSGGVYLYANQQGCDGSRLYFDGCALIMVNGEVVAQASQFSVADVEVITATVDLTDVRSFRASCSSLSDQAAETTGEFQAVRVDDFFLSPLSRCEGEREGDAGGLAAARFLELAPSQAFPPRIHRPEEEIGFGPACWLWDYLRRSGASGFFLPLSGGADSSSVAAIVNVMCHMVVEAAQAGDAQVLRDVRRVVGREPDGDYVPASPAELANCVLHTTYMGTENSSEATKSRAERLAQQIGAHHSAIVIDTIVSAVVGVFAALTGRAPQFSSRGGTNAEDLALQNIQARLRMVMAYLLAQLLPWVRGRRGFLLVLGSANVDEGLRGYMTKYDCSSADLNPIGSVSKNDLKLLLKWAAARYNCPALAEVEEAPPTAELRPMDAEASAEEEHSQLDEEDMGMTYAELGDFGRLRKIYRCGPVSMFRKLVHQWAGRGLRPSAVAEKVKSFFRFYSINRHKMVTITPAYHAEQYSPDDNRFDQRQFLYNTRWPRQFDTIDRLARGMEGAPGSKRITSQL